MNKYASVLGLNDTFMAQMNTQHTKCGYDKFLAEALTFPPAGKFTAPNYTVPGLSDSGSSDLNLTAYRLRRMGLYCHRRDSSQSLLQHLSRHRFLPLPLG